MNSSQTLSSFSLVTEPLSNTTTTRKVLLNYKTSYLATATTKTTTSLQPSFIQHRSKKLATMTSGLEQASLFVSPYQETQTSVWVSSETSYDDHVPQRRYKVKDYHSRKKNKTVMSNSYYMVHLVVAPQRKNEGTSASWHFGDSSGISFIIRPIYSAQL